MNGSGVVCVTVKYDYTYIAETKEIISKKITDVKPALQDLTIPISYVSASLSGNVNSYVSLLSELQETGPQISTSSSGSSVPVFCSGFGESTAVEERNRFYDILYDCVNDSIKATFEKQDSSVPRVHNVPQKNEDHLNETNSDNFVKRSTRQNYTKPQHRGVYKPQEKSKVQEKTLKGGNEKSEPEKSRSLRTSSENIPTKRSLTRSLSAASLENRKEPFKKKAKFTQKLDPKLREKRGNLIDEPVLIAAEKSLVEKNGKVKELKVEEPEVKDESPLSIGQVDLIVPGAIVYGKWKDKKYYSGVVKERKPENRWLILFYDGQTSIIAEKDIILDTWIPKNFEVLVNKGTSSAYYWGTIVDFKLDENGQKLYGVSFKTTKSVTFVPRQKIALKEDKVISLRKAMGPPATTAIPPVFWGDLSEANLIEGKRRTQSRCVEASSGETTPKSRKERSSDDPGQSSPLSTDFIIGLDPECDTVADLPTPKKFPRDENKHGKYTNKSEYPSVTAILGPIPPEGSDLFSGMHFLLTCSDQNPWKKERQFALAKSSTKGPPKAFDLDFTNPTFDRDRLLRQLKNGGAVVYDTFDDIPKNMYSRTYLLANMPLCTAKYIQCLAYGIRPVNNNWIIQMCKENRQKIENYFLPAGWSLEKKQFIYLPKKPARPLKGKVVIVFNGKLNSFVKFWSNIVHQLGGTTQDVTDADLDETEDFEWLNGVFVIISEPSSYSSIKYYADRRDGKVPVVSTFWLIQCLINGKICSIDSHQLYKPEYVPIE